MRSIRQINDQIKQGLEGIISQQRQQHLFHQTKLREQVVSKYLQFNACLSEQERRQIKQFIEQNA